MQPHGNRLRATRASPPGLASDDPERRATYAAALQQFDDLMDAARVIGPVSRPLPLYYAVHQAGKAIAAAWVEGDWRARGHGLTEHKRDKREWESDVLHFRVRPKKHELGVFGDVASVLRVPGLTGSVEIGALWSALPGVAGPTRDFSWPLALPFSPLVYSTGNEPPRFVAVSLRGQRFDDPAAINHLLSTYYPDAVESRPTTYQGEPIISPSPWGPGYGVTWTEAEVKEPRGEPSPNLHNRQSGSLTVEERWLVPVVGDASDRLPSVLLWWILLFGLSLLARYEPAAWREALDLDKSPIADPLAQLLDDALVIVPDLLFAAATTPGQ